jgi:hypothetical protein
MAIVAGYTRQTDGAYIVIGNYESPALAETAITDDASSDVKEYWIASSINPENDMPIILGTIDV